MGDFNWPSLTILDIGIQKNILKTLPILQKTVNLVELTFRDVFSYRDADIVIHLPRFECLYTVDKNILTILETPALRRLEIRDNSCWATGVTLPVRMMAFIFCVLTCS